MKVPKFDGKKIVTLEVGTGEFVEKQIAEILESLDIEVTGPPDRALDWLFSSPKFLSSYAEFGEFIRKVLASPWTHLLVISESKRWLHLEWLVDLLRQEENQQGLDRKKILMLLPSRDGLEGWRLWEDYTYGPSLPDGYPDIVEASIPWWRHNRHLFLAVNAVPGADFALNQAVYFTRRYKSTAIAPIYLDSMRDCAKLLCSFLSYTARAIARDPNSAGALFKELHELVEGLLPALDPSSRDAVEGLLRS